MTELQEDCQNKARLIENSFITPIKSNILAVFQI